MPVFLDFETKVSRSVTLSRMSLAAYLRALGDERGILGLSVAQDDEDPAFFTPADAAWPDVKALLRELSAAGELFVAHNWSFDGRVLHELMGIPYPRAICSIEAASCAWPNQPGGYSLENLAATLNLPSGRKLGHGSDVMRMSPAELETYCRQDTRLCRDIFHLAMARISPNEAGILELCSRAKEGEFEVDTAAVAKAVDAFADAADKYANDLAAILGDTDLIAFGADPDNHVRSVKPHIVKKLLLENLGFDTHTISEKKINPVSLAAHEEAKAAVGAAGKTNRALSHRRRIGVFRDMERVHAELNAWAAHTGRFASRAVGKGLNLLNMPKRDKEVAPLFRRSFRLPEGLCFVRADEANVEYRVTGLVTNCDTVQRLFARDVFADPYGNFGQLVTGRVITKADAVRQLFKLAVLGLGYGMGLELWVRTLLAAIASGEVLLADLLQAVEENNWKFPNDRMAKATLTKTGCSPEVVTAAYHTRRAFHELHPEFFRVARWLVQACEEVSRTGSQSAIDDMYTLPSAPPRQYIDLRVTDRFEGVSLEVWCPASGWDYPAVFWRDIGVREVPVKGVCLSLMTGRKGYRSISPPLMIENCVQAISRQRTSRAKLALADRGYPYIFNVHDELLPVVPADPESISLARQDLIDVLGPHTRDPWGWAVVINPSEINASRSWYEVDVGKLLPPIGTDAKGKPIYPPSEEWWRRLATSGPDFLDNLP